MRLRFAWVIAGSVGLFLAARSAGADPIGDLEKAYSAYAAHKYADAETRLRVLLEGKTTPLKDSDTIADTRMYLGAVLVAEGKKEEASEIFEKLLKDRPDYEPDKLRVQLEAIDAFIDVHTHLRAELGRIQAERVQSEQAAKAKAEAVRQKAAIRLAMLEKLASEERLVDHNSRWRAVIPFGVGQFQNGQRDLAFIFLSSETLLAVGSAVAAVVSVYDQVQRNEALQRNDGTALTYNANARNAAYVSDALAGGFVLTAIVGAIQAELMFVPELVTVRQRAIPLPALSPVAGPGWLGFSGRF